MNPTPEIALELAEEAPNLRGLSIDDIRAAVEYNQYTGEFRSKVVKNSGWTRGGSNGHGYLVVRVLGKYIRANRLAFAIYYGRQPSGFVDHINGDRKDNRIENLRDANCSQSAANCIRKSGKNLPKGVHASTTSNKFQARLNLNGKIHHLGSFNSEDEAAHAYNKAAIVAHGEYARLNPIGEDKLIIKPTA